ASIAVVPWVGTELMPESDEGRMDIDVELPVGTPLPVTTATILEVESRVRNAIRPEELDHLITTARPVAGWRGSGSTDADVDVLLVPVAERQASSADVETRIRAALGHTPGAEVRSRQRSSTTLMRALRGGGEARLAVEIRGHALDTAT